LKAAYPDIVGQSHTSVEKTLIPNKIGSKSKNTAFKTAEQILEARLQFLA
jgi:hypothetical protein